MQGVYMGMRGNWTSDRVLQNTEPGQVQCKQEDKSVAVRPGTQGAKAWKGNRFCAEIRRKR